MRLLSSKYRLLVLISLILFCGFLATALVSYLASSDAIEQNIAEQELPLTADSIYSEIQSDILRPVFISSLMAHDTFVRDWMLGGEKNPEQIVHYLSEVKQKYGAVTSFLVSDLSSKYYYAGGILRSMNISTPRDEWFYRMRSLEGAEYRTDVDTDLANHGAMTIFINHRVLDYKGKFIGVTGVGLTLDSMRSVIDQHQDRFRHEVYFVDPSGEIMLGGTAVTTAGSSIRSLPGLRGIAAAILNHDSRPTRLSYSTDKTDMLVNSRFIPELGWYLVVAQNIRAEVQPVKHIFVLNLAISFGVTLLVLVLTLLTVNHFQRRLERAAATDTLTGLLNRKALELLFRNNVLDSKRSGRALSAILLDIDFFKHVNDNHGHLWGDRVICGVADLIVQVVRESDAVTRWGGEEYLILLHCTLEQAGQVAELLRRTVELHDFQLPAPNQPVTISLGVAQYRQGETESAFFSRADSALYQAKHDGRNRLHLSL